MIEIEELEELGFYDTANKMRDLMDEEELEDYDEEDDRKLFEED